MDILVLPGDDIGPEITAATVSGLHAVNDVFSLGLQFETIEVGMARFHKDGTTLPDWVVDRARKADGLLLGPAGMTAYPPKSEGGINVPGTIRKALDLYANIRPAKARQSITDARAGLDCVIVRENTEGFYSDRNMFMGSGEFMPTPDCALSVRKITRQASRRIAEVAFQYAARRRKSVTSVGKRHVLQISDGLFMTEAEAVAAAQSETTYREIDVDAAAALLYSKPDAFDVILVSNMFGDILSNLAAALSGGLGLAASLNAGETNAAANAGHGSAPDIAGQNRANPAGLMISAAMLLDWLGERAQRSNLTEASKAMIAAIEVALADPESRTMDLGGAGTTSGFADAVSQAIRRENFAKPQ